MNNLMKYRVYGKCAHDVMVYAAMWHYAINCTLSYVESNAVFLGTSLDILYKNTTRVSYISV